MELRRGWVEGSEGGCCYAFQRPKRRDEWRKGILDICPGKKKEGVERKCENRARKHWRPDGWVRRCGEERCMSCGDMGDSGERDHQIMGVCVSAPRQDRMERQWGEVPPDNVCV